VDIIVYVVIVWIIIACLLPIYAIVHSYRNAKSKKNWWRGVWDFFDNAGDPGGD
tara:strand:+ start:1293 stop:1454 length:162 start_codon:yes stop_codon:yes gene_type:complete